MLNRIANRLVRLTPAFTLAGLLTGCGTMSTTTIHRDESCIVGEESATTILLTIPFKSYSPEQFSFSCREGRAGAQATYLHKDAEGKLNRKGVVFALEFNKEVQDRIKTTTDAGETAANKYYKDVSYFFNFYLQKIGGMTIESVQKRFDELKAEAAAARAAAQTPQAPTEPKPVPRCVATGNSVIRSCKVEPAVTSAPKLTPE